MVSEKRLGVLGVDDQESICDVVSETIRYAGHQIVGTAQDGEEAVHRAEELRPDPLNQWSEETHPNEQQDPVGQGAAGNV